MTTIRVAKRERFTTVAREAVTDARLSFRARGVLVWLLDKPDDWESDSERIAQAGQEGRDAIRTALKELVVCGYLVRSKRQDKAGHWVTDWTVYEQPTTGNPASVIQSSETRPSEDQALIPKTETESYVPRFPKKEKPQQPTGRFPGELQEWKAQ